MILDAKATEEARKRQTWGIRRLNDVFGWSPAMSPAIPQTGRAIGESRRDRLVWRAWLDTVKPERVTNRRARKAARKARRKNRRRR